MQLSDAIVLGSTLLKPCGGGHGLHYAANRVGCALEMALVAVGRTDLSWSRAGRVWPWLGFGVPGNMVEKVVREFDTKVMYRKEWTLDQFVDWIRSIEPAEPEQEPRIERITVRPREIKNLEPLNDWETGQVQPEDKALAQLADEHFDFRAGTR